MSGSKDSTRLLQRIQNAADAVQHNAAADLAEEALSESPDAGALHEAAGLLLHQLGDHGRTRELLESAQSLVPLRPESEVALAECHIRAGENDLATSLLENVGRRKPDAPEVLLRAAELLERLAEFRAAWCICRRVVNEFPDEARAWFDLSFYMGRLRFPFPCIEAACRRAISLDPANVTYRISLVSALSRLERQEDAHQLLRGLGAAELSQVRCAGCLTALRALYESVNDWRGVCLCNEQLLLRSAESDSECC